MASRVKVIITGKSASGKSYLKNLLVKKHGYTYYKPYTTREKRKIDGDNEYEFVDEKEFNKLKELGVLIDNKTFNDWQYGYSKYCFVDPYNVLIMSPKSIQSIKKTNASLLDNWQIVFIDEDYEVRYNRLVERYANEDNMDYITKRMAYDEQDFISFTDEYYNFKMSSVSAEDVAIFIKYLKICKNIK